MNISIGQNCLTKKNPGEYIVPPQEGSELHMLKRGRNNELVCVCVFDFMKTVIKENATVGIRHATVS